MEWYMIQATSEEICLSDVLFVVLLMRLDARYNSDTMRQPQLTVSL